MVMHVVDARRKRNIMSSAINKLDKLRRIVRLKQVMRRWRVLSLRLWSSVRGRGFGGAGGSVAVYVGPDRSRFAVPVRFFNLPVFSALLERAEEEYGFQPAGGLTIPCDPAFFQWILDAIGDDQAHLAPLGLEALLALFAASVRREADACNGRSPLLPKTKA